MVLTAPVVIPLPFIQRPVGLRSLLAFVEEGVLFEVVVAPAVVGRILTVQKTTRCATSTPSRKSSSKSMITAFREASSPKPQNG